MAIHETRRTSPRISFRTIQIGLCMNRPIDSTDEPQAIQDLSGLDVDSRVILSRIQERLGFRAAMVNDDLIDQQRLLKELQAWSGRLDLSVHKTSVQIDKALTSFTSLVEELNANLGSTFRELKTGLEQTRQLLDDKRIDLENVMDAVGQIGKTIRMLSINAQIASAKAGEHGRTFSVVAREIKSLANEATESSTEAVKIMNLTDIEKLLNNFDTLAQKTLQNTHETLVHTKSDLLKVVELSRSELDEISANSRIVAETLGTVRVVVDRLIEKNASAVNLNTSLDRVWTEPDPMNTLRTVAHKEKIRSDPNFDRLDDIRRRGKILVGIEPDFKGLSFRTSGGPLRGLDVEYAQAFAHWLGVRCQFIEYPWDQCTSLLWAGRRAGEDEADVVWSALPPSPRYHKVAYSDSYTCLDFVLARRIGDSRIQDLNDLNGRTLGCINDPAAFKTLEDAGVRWTANADLPNGHIRLGNLITYSDQSRIHDCLADGLVDAFAVDRPIYYWACHGQDSPWRDRIEILPGNLAKQPWYYAVGVADSPASFRLLREINAFIRNFRSLPERRQLEMKWQGDVIDSNISYRDEKANLRGEPEMLPDYRRWIDWVGESDEDESDDRNPWEDRND